MKNKLILVKTPTGFFLWKNPEEKDQEILGGNVPFFDAFDENEDLRKYKLSTKNCEEISLSEDEKFSRKELIDFTEMCLTEAINKDVQRLGRLRRFVIDVAENVLNKWEVEIETTFIEEEKTGLKDLSWGRVEVKLDKDGCIILKRVK